MVVHGSMAEVEMVVTEAWVGWMVVKPERKVLVGGGAVTLGRMEATGVDLEVELGGSSVMVILLQDLQHMRQ